MKYDIESVYRIRRLKPQSMRIQQTGQSSRQNLSKDFVTDNSNYGITENSNFVC